MLIGRIIDVIRPAALPATLRTEIERRGLTVGPTERTIELPMSVGLDAVDIANRLGAIAPDLGLVLRLEPAVVCHD